jgi:hypothetical protein
MPWLLLALLLGDVIVKGSRADIKWIGNDLCACNSPLVRER